MDEKNGDTKKKVWTDAERLELAEKLDKDLEDYINSLEKRTDSNECPEDCWSEEIDKHPFFMTQMPENPTEMSPLVEGLQQLKYSEDYNTPSELALSYKEDGNFNFKYKKYHLAILNFSKGISTKCDDSELLAQLYNNRALAQLKLKNYRSGLRDCKRSLELKPSYLKSLHTAAKCSFYVKEYDQCINYCDQILNIATNDKEINTDIDKLRGNSIKNKKLMMRDSWQQTLKEKKIDQLKINIIKAIKSRNIRVDDSDLFDNQWHVHFDDTNMLIWPVIFAYPENGQTDFVQNFNESIIFREQLMELFEEPPAWDNNKRYQINNLSIYFEDCNKAVHKVQTDQSLKEILQHKSLVVKNGTPWFFILVAGSIEENFFLKSYEQ
ncbi:PREDICTED: tetratricopeptide repeat protein 4 [Ceratosolen solmsi marchali]|uniref:Tetratricopeptide repeat protein 4 n=1 Tax=Ceratosolen solmsi marchali TaxID=326594 RepID=A0AAJ6YUB9_9HYME|nr:PREDICTED: tetratricopeptide repeat protein 4 [Ceratosolen solmsi marchali]